MSHNTMQAKSLESDVRYQLTEARIVLRRRSVIPLMVGQLSTASLDTQAGAACETSMLKFDTDCVTLVQVEHDLAWVRLLIGLHGMRARKEVNEIVSGIVEMGAALQYTEDKLTNIMEAAQVRDSFSTRCTRYRRSQAGMQSL